jgi:hypothetical protein
VDSAEIGTASDMVADSLPVSSNYKQEKCQGRQYPQSSVSDFSQKTVVGCMAQHGQQE